MKKLKVAVVGAGKMGSIHAKVYDQLDVCDLVAVVDVDIDKAKSLADQYKCQAYDNCDEIIGEVDAVTIASPTIYHLELAEKFITNKVAVMIEKPLAADSEQGRRIVSLAEANSVVVAVGHSERCNPVVQAMKRLDIEPKFIESNRISPYPFRSTDVGVVLDVMIHDIDIILSMASSSIKRVEAVGVNVIDKHEDICNARVVFDNGCIANITASRLALKTERRVRVFSRQAYLSMDYFRKTGIVIKADPNTDLVEWIKEKQNQGDFDFSTVSWPDLLHIEEIKIDDREPLRVEQEAFLEAVADDSRKPEVSAAEGLAAIELAEMILESIKQHDWK
jgi:predicted dehydrogenase